MGKSEEACRHIFQTLVRQSFVCRRPAFLSHLELDGYCKTHELAFEYNGIQHYRYTPFFHPTLADFHRQLERDELKQRLCQRHGLILMTIPHSYSFRNLPALHEHIYQEVRKAERVRNETYMFDC